MPRTVSEAESLLAYGDDDGKLWRGRDDGSVYLISEGGAADNRSRRSKLDSLSSFDSEDDSEMEESDQEGNNNWVVRASASRNPSFSEARSSLSR